MVHDTLILLGPLHSLYIIFFPHKINLRSYLGNGKKT